MKWPLGKTNVRLDLRKFKPDDAAEPAAPEHEPAREVDYPRWRADEIARKYSEERERDPFRPSLYHPFE